MSPPGSSARSGRNCGLATRSRCWTQPAAGQLRLLPLMRLPRDADGDRAFCLALARAVASPAHPFDEATARDAVAREQDRGIVSFRDVSAQRRLIGATWHGQRLRDMRIPCLVILPGVGHELPRAAWPRIATEVRSLADRAT